MLDKKIISNLSVISAEGKELSHVERGTLIYKDGTPVKLKFQTSEPAEEFQPAASLHFTVPSEGDQREKIEHFSFKRKNGNTAIYAVEGQSVGDDLTTAEDADVPLVPGCEVIGWGFNIFGEYNSTSKIRQLIDLGVIERVQDFHGQDYEVPRNVSADTSATGFEGSATTFNSRNEFQESFSAKGKVSGSYGAFSGSFSAEYSQFESSSSEYNYSVMDAHYDLWFLSLRDASTDELTPSVRKSAEYTELPDVYIPPSGDNPGNGIQFFRFFDKYGTHYVNKVGLGGTLYAYCSLAKSYNMTNDSANASLTAQYNGLFVKTKAQAEASWEQVNKTWQSEATFSCGANGGNPTLLNPVLNPEYGLNYHEQFEAWKASLPVSPEGTWFELEPVAKLFEGDKADAITTAYNAYANSKLYVQAVWMSKTPPVLQFNGNTQEWPENRNEYDAPVPYWALVIDAETLLVKESISFDQESFESTYKAILEPYKDRKHILVFTTFNMWGMTIPQGSLYTFLLDCGGGSELIDLEEHYGDSGAGSYVRDNYILVGMMGQGVDTGLETLDHADGQTGNVKQTTTLKSTLIPVRITGDTQMWLPKWD